MLKQIIKVIRLLGLRRAARMKKHHEQGLTYIRGYAATSCWWTLLNSGFLDELDHCGRAVLSDYVAPNDLDASVAEAIIEYLDGIGLLHRDGDCITFTDSGRAIFAEPRGMFELLYAYEPCFGNLPDLLTGAKRYGRDLTRRITYVGKGSGRLCEQLPYPVMRRMVLDQQRKMVLDLGCGDLAFLAGLCKLDPDIRGHGIDNSQEMIDYNRKGLAENNYDGHLTTQCADMFELRDLSADLPAVDCITACDTFHEYLQEPDKLIALLKDLRSHFPETLFCFGEFCLQDAQWLRKHPTASLEHHLFHQLSNQQIGSAQQWRDIFGRAGLEIMEEQIYDLIGHGYFLLR